MQKLLIYLLASASLLLSACSVHKIDVQQGNVLEPEIIEQLKTGMTQKQVRFLLGTPTLQDPFHHNRWDYIFSEVKNGEMETVQRITLTFSDDTLVNIERHGLPDGATGR